MKNTEIFYVGTYCTPGPYVPEAKGEGILSCCLSIETGEIQKVQVYSGKLNSTYLAKDNGGHLFVACDNFDKTGEVKAFSINEKSINLLSTSSTYGASSCHIEYSPSLRQIYISSYSNGQLGIHNFDGTSIDPQPQLLSYEGSGPNGLRQEASHIHQAVVSPNKKWLYACDLGCDKIWFHELQSEKLKVKTGFSTPPGSGPRHLVFHPFLSLIYVFCELDGGLLTYKVDSATGFLELISQISTLPKDFSGEPAGAAIRIHPNAKALYVSNRNHNSITAFAINSEGELEYHSNFPVKGMEPRDINIDPCGQWLLSANQNSHNIIPFKLEPASGLPIGTSGPEFKCGTPVCILF